MTGQAEDLSNDTTESSSRGQGFAYLAVSAATDLLTTAVAFGTGLLIARFLGPHDRGVYTLVTTSGMLIAYAAGLGLFESLLARNRQPGPTHRRAALLLGVGGALAMLFLAAITHESNFAVYALAPIMWGLLQVSLARAAIGQRWSWVYLRALPNAIQIAITFTLWALGYLTVTGAILAMLVGYFIAMAADRLLNGSFKGRNEPLREVTASGAKQHMMNLPRMANYRGPILVLGVLGTSESVGLFAVASAVGSLVPTLTWSVTQNLLVLTAKKSDDVRRTQRVLTLVGYTSSLLAAGGCLVIGDWLLTTLYGNTYGHTWPALVMVLAVQGMWLHSGLIQVHFRATQLTHVGASIEFLGIITMVAVMTLTQQSGYLSAAFGTVTTVVVTLGLSLLARRWTSERIAPNV